jgi:hypothetical protein
VTSQFIAAAASVALLGTGFAGVDGTRSIEAIPGKVTMLADNGSGGGSGKCKVDVIRTGAPGSADITRQVLDNGTCVCTITTGPSNGNGAAEGIVGDLLRDRTCDGAPAPGEKPAAAGGPFSLLPVLGAVAAAGGAAAAVGSDSAG